jgi:GxxExxY protein
MAQAYEPIPERDEQIAHEVIGAAIEVHRVLGPGFLEKIYEEAMLHELGLRSVKAEHEKELAVPYKGTLIHGQKLDLLVEGRVIVELKAVEALAPIHDAQLLSYLKAANLRLGLLINFRVPVLREGIKRKVR